MARVLFTSCPAYGHALPMLPLIRAAERAGHDVRVATGAELVGPLAARGLDVHAVGPTWQSAWSAHEAVWAAQDLREEQKMMDGVVALFGTPALARLDDLVAMAAEWRPDVVVHEVLELAGSMLAGRVGIPGVVHGIGPMFPFYAQLIAAAGAAIGEPELWAQLSTERALDLCPPSLQPDGPQPWPQPSRCGRAPESTGSCHPAWPRPSRPTVRSPTSPSAPSRTPTSRDFTTGITALAEYDGVVVATTGRRLDSDELGPCPRTPSSRSSCRRPTCSSGPTCWSRTAARARCSAASCTACPRLPCRAGPTSRTTPPSWSVPAPGCSSTPRTTRSSRSRPPSPRSPGTRRTGTAAERVRDEIAAMPDADAAWAGLGF